MKVKSASNELGRLIVFEGPDGVGKSTVSKRVAAALRQCRVPVKWHSFPGRRPRSLGARVYSIHHDRRLSKIHPLSLQLLHVAAHIELIDHEIKPALANGHWVVLDRYWWSAWVYGVAKGVPSSLLEHAIQMEHDAWDGIVPDVLFLLERPNIGIDKFISKTYRQLAAREKNNHPIVVVKNNSTLDALFRKVSSTSPLSTQAYRR